MDGDYALCSIILLFIMILALAVFYCYEAAIEELSEAELQKKSEEGDKKAKHILSVIQKPGRMTNAISSLTLLSGMVAGIFVIPSCADLLYKQFPLGEEKYAILSRVIFAVLVAVIAIGLMLLFGILVPKQMGRNHPERCAGRYDGLVRLIMVLLCPLTLGAEVLARLVLLATGSVYHTDEENVTEEEIISMVNEGHEQGVLEESEAEMIHNIFEFDDKDAGDIMTHRTEIAGLDRETTLSDAVDMMLEANNSRYPVYQDNIDNIVGILHLKDAMRAYRSTLLRSQSVGTIQGLLREARFIPESRNVSDLFRKMQKENIYMVIVIDEYGQTAGLITMEDILEEIVGNIQDEYDENEEEIRQLDQNHFLLKGSAPLDEVAQLLGIDFEDDSHETINGFMIDRLGRIPSFGEQPEVIYKEFVFHALTIENKVIGTISVEPKRKEEASSATEASLSEPKPEQIHPEAEHKHTEKQKTEEE